MVVVVVVRGRRRRPGANTKYGDVVNQNERMGSPSSFPADWQRVRSPFSPPFTREVGKK